MVLTRFTSSSSSLFLTVALAIATSVIVEAYAPIARPLSFAPGQTSVASSSPWGLSFAKTLQQQKQPTSIAGRDKHLGPLFVALEDPPPEVPENDEGDQLSPTTSSEAVSSTPSNEEAGDLFSSPILQGVLLLFAAGIAFNLTTMAIDTATQFFDSLAESMTTGFWGMVGNIPEAIGALLASLFEFLKVFLPAVGRLGKSAYETAAPIVGETSQRALEAATPVLQEATDKISEAAAPVLEEATLKATEAAAPYTDKLSRAVETSVWGPLREAQTAVDAQIQGATQAVTDAVDAQIQGATTAVGGALDGAVQEAGRAIDARLGGGE